MAISHSSVLINTGQTIDNTTVNSNQRQVTNIGGPDALDTANIASVLPSQPTGTEPGLVVREAQQGQGTMAHSHPVVIASDQSAVPVSGTFFQATQPVSGTVTANAGSGTLAISAASLPLPTGASTSAKQPALGTAGSASTDVITVQGITSMTPLKTDSSATTQPVSGTVAVTQSTSPWVITGSKTGNNAAPGATNVGTLPALANAAVPSFTEGNQTALSMDLAGNLRVYGHPPNVLGAYMINGRTGIYTAQPAGAPLFSFRWTSATALGVIMRVAVTVATTTATTVVGNAERELIIARSFTVSDSGGTAVVLTGNNQKMRTSQATSVVGDMRFASNAQLTAGTRTLDANPIASSIAVLPLLFTGIDIGTGGVVTTTTAVPSQGLGGREMVPLLNATTGQDYPIVLAQNEGFIVRIGKDAQPTTVAQQTYVQASWAEVSAY